MIKNEKIGISLIVLVITIVVVIVLAGAIILNLVEDNPISNASKSVYLSDVRAFQAELELYKTKHYADKLGAYYHNTLQADQSSVTYNEEVDATKSINDLIVTLGQKEKYAGQFIVVDGKLVFIGSDTNEQTWAREIGLDVLTAGEISVTIIPPIETVISPGIDVSYTVKFSSNAALRIINLVDNIEVLDSEGVALTNQPEIIIGNISGKTSDAMRQVEITIKTDNLTNGEYKLKVKAGSIKDANNVTNTTDTISLIGFDIVDNIPPENPTMSANPAIWTNGNVAVTIAYTSDTNIKQYSLNGTNWNNYTDPIVVSANNTTVYAKGFDAAGNESGVASMTVTNIDKVNPTVTASSGTKTSSSITVVAVANDLGGSGVDVASYQYSKDNGTTWTTGAATASYIFTELTTGTYQCKVKVADLAGNTAISNAVAISTQAIGTISLVASPSTWTNGNVSVTITYPTGIITKQYSIDGITWNDYISPIIVSTNNTTIYAKGLDAGGNQTSQATLTITKIDNVPPTVTASDGGATSSSVTVTATASDTGGSLLKTTSYQYSKDNGTTWTSATSATSYTFSALTTGTYQCKVKVADNAGNTTISNAVEIATLPVGTITLSANPTAWTNGSVTVTITYPTNATTKQYSTNGTTWNTYTSPIAVSTNNTTVYAKGSDAGANQIAQATLTVTNIDKVVPTITLSQDTTATVFNVTITAAINDADSGIMLKKWMDGNRAISYFASAGTTLSGNTFVVSSSGIYTVYAKDNVGNEKVQTINITNIPTPPTAPGAFSSPTGNLLRSSSCTVTWGSTGSWGTITTGQNYRLEVEYNQSGIWNLVANKGTTLTHTFSIPSSTSNTKICFRVRAESDSGTSAWVSSSVCSLISNYTLSYGSEVGYSSGLFSGQSSYSISYDANGIPHFELAGNSATHSNVYPSYPYYYMTLYRKISDTVIEKSRWYDYRYYVSSITLTPQ